MGRENYYKPGSFYRVDQRTGFAVRAERTRQEWNGLIVRDKSWEIRQPQDFVKGIRDDQTVPRALPRTPPVFTGPTQSTLSANARNGASSVSVNAPFGFSVGDSIGIMLSATYSPNAVFSLDFNKDFRHTATYAVDNLGEMFFCTIAGGSGDFSSDFNSDFDSPTGAQYTLATLWIQPYLAGFAQSGSLIVNLSAAEITPESYGASNGG